MDLKSRYTIVILLLIVTVAALLISLTGTRTPSNGLVLKYLNASIINTSRDGSIWINVTYKLSNCGHGSNNLEGAVMIVYMGGIKVDQEEANVGTLAPGDSIARSLIVKVTPGEAAMIASRPSTESSNLTLLIQKGSVNLAKVKGTLPSRVEDFISPPAGLLESSGEVVQFQTNQWLVDGVSVHEVMPLELVQAQVHFKALTPITHGSICVVVMEDIKVWGDIPLESNCVTSAEKGKEFMISVAFTSGFRRTHSYEVRGYYLELYTTGGISIVGANEFGKSGNLWVMKSSYPPRLKISYITLRDTQVTWYVNGKRVSEVSEGASVVAEVTIKAPMGVYDDRFKICVVEDVAHGKDNTVKCVTKTATLPPGGSIKVRIPFVAYYKSKSYVFFKTYTRGFYIKVNEYRVSASWSQPSHYPPRLKVNK